MFGTVLSLACTGMHIYIFWRAASVPVVYRHVPREILIGAGVVLWAIFFTGRVFGHGGTGALAGILEFCGMNWMAVLFLTSVCLLAYGYRYRFWLLAAPFGSFSARLGFGGRRYCFRVSLCFKVFGRR